VEQGTKVKDRSRFSYSPPGREAPTDVGAAISRGAIATLRSGRARAGLALLLLPGAAWFVALASYSGSIALGFTPAHGFANALATVLLTPALAACALPFLDACLALSFGRDGAARWSRIMIEAAAGLIVACFATVISPALWPGVAFLALATALGFVAGLLRWRPSEVVPSEPAGLPLLLLLLDEPAARSTATRPVVTVVASESDAA
jgi:hypothetical protein